MFGWFGKNKQQELLESLQKEVSSLREEIKQKEEEAAPEVERVEYPEHEKYKKSSEPWVVVMGDKVTEEGLRIHLDWNDAFIKYLKENNIVGTDENQIVQKWLAMVAKNVSDKISSTTNEYE